jgi:hypothetical protein
VHLLKHAPLPSLSPGVATRDISSICFPFIQM